MDQVEMSILLTYANVIDLRLFNNPLIHQLISIRKDLTRTIIEQYDADLRDPNIYEEARKYNEFMKNYDIVNGLPHQNFYKYPYIKPMAFYVSDDMVIKIHYRGLVIDKIVNIRKYGHDRHLTCICKNNPKCDKLLAHIKNNLPQVKIDERIVIVCQL